MNLPQQSIAPRNDLREMLRVHIVRSALACMERADDRRAKRLTTMPSRLPD